MKIGDTVSFACGLDRHPELGVLTRIVLHKGVMMAVIRQSHRVCMRSLKYVKSATLIRKQTKAQMKRAQRQRLQQGVKP